MGDFRGLVPEDENGDGIAITGVQDTLPRDLLAGAPTIDKLRRRFDEARSTLSESRLKSQRDRDYYDGPLQLDSEVRSTLKLRGQPAIYTNRIRPAVNGVLGVLEGSRTDPRAYARNPDDENAADVATKALRFIAEQSRFGDVKLDVADNFLVEGTGAVIVEFADGKIVPTQIRYEEFYADPYSRRADYGDARYMGVAKWLDADQIKERWPDRIDDIGDPMRPQDGGVVGEMYEDRPVGMAWVDIRRRRVMLIEEYAVERGQWMRTVYIAAGVLEYGPSPYLEYVEGGGQRPCNPIIAQSCYVDKENARYGIVRDMIPIQDEVNARRSRALHAANSRQVQNVDPMAPPVSDEIVRAEAAKVDGVIPVGWNVIPPTGIEVSNVNLLIEAKAEIERMGPTPAIVGRLGAESASGRSKQVSQQAGLTELARPLGRLGAWELRVYRQSWDRARQFWNEPMFIRVTDNVQAPEFLQVNEPTTIAQALEAAMGGDKKAIEALGQVIPPPAMEAAAQGDPQATMMIQQFVQMNGEQPIMVKNRLAEMDVDIIIDTVPDTATLQEEVWGELRELAASGMDIFSPQFELMIEMSPLQDKARVVERLKKFREQGMEQQQEQAAKVAQAEEEARQLAMAQGAAEVEKTRADTLKTQSETQLNEVRAFTTGLEAMQPQDGFTDQ